MIFGSSVLTFEALIIVGVPQAKHMHGFSADFQDMFTPTDSRAD